MTLPAPVVTYLRVSTDRQGQSGLGLDAQRSAVATYTAGRTVLREFVEVESGRKDDRPQLAVALALCRQRKARLVIAKLDRLAARVALVAQATVLPLAHGRIRVYGCNGLWDFLPASDACLVRHPGVLSPAPLRR